MSADAMRDAAADRVKVQEVIVAVTRGDLELAARLSQAALAIGVSHPLLFKLRAVTHERHGRLDAAIRDFQSALALAPNDFAASSALGSCLARSGRIPEALAALDASIALNGAYAPAHCNRGWALETSGDRAGARAAYERAIGIDPDNLQALGGLAAVSAQSGQSAAAASPSETSAMARAMLAAGSRGASFSARPAYSRAAADWPLCAEMAASPPSACRLSGSMAIARS